MKPTNIFAIIKKELRSYFDGPTAYIVMIVFLLLWEFFFFRDAFIIGEASLRNLMSYVPWLFLILIPAITMGSIANEISDGTIEFLLTHPLKILEMVIGKFLASLFVVALSLSFMFAIAFSFDQFGTVDWGVVLGQYLASLLLAGSFIALGLFVSSLLANQISALLVSVTTSFIFIVIGLELVTLSLPGPVASLFEQVSVLGHFLSMSRGVIDIRDLWYFLSAIIIFLSLTYLQILRMRVGNQKSLFNSYVIGIGLFIGITVMLNIVGARVPGRYDLTSDKAFQLSDTTKEVLGNLDDVVNIKLYASNELPARLRPILRDSKDILRDYEFYSNGNVKLSIIDPTKDENAVREANSLGIREVQFNVIGQEELQLSRGYLGLAILYGGDTEAIPILNTSTDLEYQLTSFIKKLTTEEKKTIGFVTGHGEKDLNTDYLKWSDELSNLYDITQLDLNNETVTLDATISAVVIAGPTEEFPEEQRAKVAEYFDAGGSVMFLLDGVTVNENAMFANANDNSLADFTPTFGVDLNQDIVFDTRSNQMVTVQTPNGAVIAPYRFWPRIIADPDTNSTLTKGVRNMVLPWPSSFTLNEERLESEGLTAQSLFVTTPYAGSQVGTYDVNPNNQSVPTNLSEQLMVVSVVREGATEEEVVPRAIFVGDSDFLTDTYVNNTPENLAFGIEGIAWLSQEQSLAELQLKQRQTRNLVFEDETQIMLVRYGNMAFAFLVPLLIGAFRLIRRNNLKQLEYRYE